MHFSPKKMQTFLLLALNHLRQVRKEGHVLQTGLPSGGTKSFEVFSSGNCRAGLIIKHAAERG